MLPLRDSDLGHDVNAAHDDLVDVSTLHEIFDMVNNRLLATGPNLSQQILFHAQALAQILESDEGQVIKLPEEESN